MLVQVLDFVACHVLAITILTTSPQHSVMAHPTFAIQKSLKICYC